MVNLPLQYTIDYYTFTLTYTHISAAAAAAAAEYLFCLMFQVQQLTADAIATSAFAKAAEPRNGPKHNSISMARAHRQTHKHL